MRQPVKGGSFVFAGGPIDPSPIANWAAVAGFTAGLYGRMPHLALNLSLRHMRANSISPGLIADGVWTSRRELRSTRNSPPRTSPGMRARTPKPILTNM
jgi:hypothetical protein